MARPRAKELTMRELEVMHVFWECGEQTVTEVRDRLAAKERDLAYTTVATLIRILHDKGFLKTTNDQRPLRYVSVRAFDEVSQSLVGDMIDRVFGGKRDLMLLRMFEGRKLSPEERAALEDLLEEGTKL